MKDLKKASFLLVSILLYLSPPSTAYDVVETCQIVPNNTFIADPTNCAGWAYCVNGSPIYGQCDSGLLYNSLQADCDWPDDVTCTTANVTTMCTGLNAVYKANPTDCQSYCYCENGATGCTLCPTGQVYDPNSISCVWPTSYTCSLNNPCTLVANNVFVQDVTNCAGYYQCANGVGTAGTCPSGYLYNAIEGMCDYPSNVVCPSGSSSSSSSGSSASNLVGNSTTCANVTSGQFYVSDGATCQGYFYCSNGTNTTAPNWGQCPDGSQFSPSLQECVNSYAVACPYNRCEGLTYTFVAAVNTNCTEYDICSSGVTELNSEASCPSDYPYFDEAQQACVQSQPDYAICS